MTTTKTHLKATQEVDFDALYYRCKAAVYYKLGGLGLNPQDLEDAFHTGLLEVVQALETRPGNTPAWYVQRSVFYARTYVRDHIHKHSTQTIGMVVSTEEEDELLVEDFVDAYGKDEAGFELAEAQELLASLPEDTQDIVLCRAAGYNITETARKVGVHRRVVTKRLLKAQEAVLASA
ncbi:MAG: sigma-70 family RNA polymerase sigma factor [Chloroflexaceae bacterium]|nr:sigma-70 family RNA polymerase sigma factor [Chloroflexaceae bacterium]